MHDLNFLQSTFDNGGSLTSRPRVVLVEDDALLGKSVKKFIEKTLNIEVAYFDCSQKCNENLSALVGEDPFCLVTDISFDSGPDGLLLIDSLKEKKLNFFSIAMTGFGSIENAIAATKKGVFHYLTKPFEVNELASLIKQGFHAKLNIELQDRNPETVLPNRIFKNKFKVEGPTEEDMFCSMIGRSPQMKRVFETIKKVAKTDSTVLINGPSGTGKELIAQAIHKLSARQNEKKINVNCGAIPAELLESELFGHTKGAFTGAIANRKGRFEQAHKGTIFLDEIGDMPLLLQVKLLRVLQTRQIEPVGGSETINVDVRVVTATHKNLEKAVQDGTFREDLYYRFNVIPINVPALKDRREDIPLLISYFLSRYVSADGSNSIEFDDKALELLMSYDWPGNVRELENLIERLVILKGGNVVTAEDLPAKIYRHNPFASSLYQDIFELPHDGVDLKEILSKIEDSLIVQALTRTKGNKNQASKLLTLNRTTLIEKMKKKEINLNF